MHRVNSPSGDVRTPPSRLRQLSTQFRRPLAPLAVVGASAFLALTACNDSSSVPIPVYQYTRLACAEGPLPSDTTWGEYRDRLQEHLETLQDIDNPPLPARDYHAFAIETDRLMLDIAAQFDQDALVGDGEEIRDDERFWQNVSEGAIVSAALGPDAFRELEAAGCWYLVAQAEE